MSSSRTDLGEDKICLCVDCGENLERTAAAFTCMGCERSYRQDSFGVWDFRVRAGPAGAPKIFEEAEFHRWLKIFNEQESKAWVIYKNALFRFFAQSGHRILGKSITKNRAPEDYVLEIGAGTGALLNFTPDKNFVAVDMSLESLRGLKSKFPRVTCIYASASALPFNSGAFQHVVSLHTLEHLYFLAEALQEMRRVMHERGTLYYAIPTEGGAAFALGRKFITGPHLRKKYNLDVQYVMDREHINDAPRVLKFLRMHYDGVTRRYWPLPFLRLLSLNALIFGEGKIRARGRVKRAGVKRDGAAND